MKRRGRVEVICGCMYSGKTEELLRRLVRAKIAKLKVLLFKPALDDRYSENDVVSHSKMKMPSLPFDEAYPEEILEQVEGAAVVGIDEGQFCSPALVKVCETLANQGKRVIVAGLDTDFAGRPFGPMPNLMAVAEMVRKVHAICTHPEAGEAACGEPACRSQRTVEGDNTILVGETEAYAARCRKHYRPPEK